MRILFLILLLQVGPIDNGTIDGVGAGQDFRNPFRRYRPTPTPIPADKSTLSATAAADANAATDTITAPSRSIDIQTSIRRVLPSLLNDLRAIVIVHEKTGYALFGDRIVSVSDTIAGFTVREISFDEVVLSDEWDVVKRKLGNPSIRSTTQEQ